MENKPNTNTNTKSILATLPSELEAQLRKEAEAQERSRNAQLVWILRQRYASLPSHQEQTAQAA